MLITGIFMMLAQCVQAAADFVNMLAAADAGASRRYMLRLCRLAGGNHRAAPTFLRPPCQQDRGRRGVRAFGAADGIAH